MTAEKNVKPVPHTPHAPTTECEGCATRKHNARLQARAYGMAQRDVREQHRGEFDERYSWHLARLRGEGTT